MRATERERERERETTTTTYVKFSPLTTSTTTIYFSTKPTAIIPPTTRPPALPKRRSRSPVSRHAPHSFASVTLRRRSNFSRCLCPPCVYYTHRSRVCAAEYNNKRWWRLEILLSAATAAVRLSYAVKRSAWRWSISAGRVVRCCLRWRWRLSRCSDHTLTFPKKGWPWLWV